MTEIILPTYEVVQQTLTDATAMREVYKQIELFAQCVNTALIATEFKNSTNRVQPSSLNAFYGYTLNSLAVMMAVGFHGEFLFRLCTPLGYINLFGQGIDSNEAARATKYLLEHVEETFGQKPEPVKLVPVFALQDTVGFDNFMTNDYKSASTYILWRRTSSPPKPEDAFVFTTVDRKIYEVTRKIVSDIRDEQKAEISLAPATKCETPEGLEKKM